MPSDVKAFNWSVTNLCVVCWDVQVNKQVRWTFLKGCPSSSPLFFLFCFILIFSSYCVLFLFVLHVQFCKAKSRCALSQLFRQQRSLTVSFALTYNLTVLSSPFSSPQSSLLSFTLLIHFFLLVFFNVFLLPVIAFATNNNTMVMVTAMNI